MSPLVQRGAFLLRKQVLIPFLFITFGVILFTSSFYGDLSEHASKLQNWGGAVFSGPSKPKNMTIVIPEIWKPYMHNLSDATYHAENINKDFKLPDDAHRFGHMGKKVLILDVDSRLDQSPGAMLYHGPPNRETMKGRMAGIMNHFLYSLVHGYDYRLVRSPTFDDRHGTWVKLPIVKEALKTYDVVVFLDSDALFEQIGLPIEWLMGYYRVKPNTILAMAEDPNAPHNQDAKGWVMWNTGFIIAQKSDRAQELFERWIDCPKGDRYPDCKRWAYDWAHEQAAFANHIRYDYENKVDLMPIGCNEGNGMPGPHGGSGCNGDIIRHYWFDKHTTIKELYELLSDDIIRGLHRHFHEGIDQYYRDISDKSFPLPADIVI